MTGISLRQSAMLAALLLMAPLLAIVPGASAPAAATTAAEFTFEGGGWGHGVGLSQYGAYAMARVGGMDRSAILDHYYPGTVTASLGDEVPAPEPLWVNLEREATTVVIRNRAIGGGATPMSLRYGDRDVPIPTDEAVRIDASGAAPDGTPLCRVRAGDVDTTAPCDLDLTWDGDEAGPTARAVVEWVRRSTDTGDGGPCTLLDWNAIPTAVRPCTYARGSLHIRPDNNTPSFHLVLEIDVDDYVLGISEMPYYWALPTEGPNGMAALEAQAVAARSYALHRQADRGDPAGRPGCWCQLYDTAIDQRYVGWGHSGLGQQGWLDAVRATAGEVRIHPEENNGRVPIEAFYGSSSYGRTEPSSLVFAQDAPYLRSVADPWSLDPTVRNPEGRWTKTFTGDELAAILGWSSSRSVAAVEVASCSPAGTIAELRFVDGVGAGDVRRARTLRSLLGLRSPQITSVTTGSAPAPPCGGLGALDGVGAGLVSIDDDANGDSAGNGDGVAQCGETIEVGIELATSYPAALRGITASLTSSDPAVTVLHNRDSTYPRLEPGGSQTNDDDWDLDIDPAVADGSVIPLQVVVRSSGGGPWVLEVPLPIECAPPSTTTTTAPPIAASAPLVTSVVVDDGPTGDSVGNGDGLAQCGEVVEVLIEVSNPGDTSLSGVTGTVATDDGDLSILHNTDSAYPNLGPGARAGNQNDFDLAISAEAEPHIAVLSLRLVAGDGATWDLAAELPIGCEGVAAPEHAISVAGIVIDDGVRGDSIGNGDRRAQCGETIELYVGLTATDSISGATAALATSDTDVTILYNTTSRYGDLSPGGVVENGNDWDIRIDEPVPDGHQVPFTLSVDVDGNHHDLAFDLPIECAGAGPAAPVTVGSFTVDDGIRGDSVGNNDRAAQCGETIELYVELLNTGAEALTGLVATLSTSDPDLAIRYNTSSAYPALDPGEGGENANDWDLTLAPTLRGGAGLVVSVEVGGSTWDLPIQLPVACP